MEGLVRNIGAFSRFLEVVSFSHTQSVNVSNVARECQVERKTVAGYLDRSSYASSVDMGSITTPVSAISWRMRSDASR